MKKIWILPIAAMMTVACGGGASALEDAAAEMEAAMEEATVEMEAAVEEAEEAVEEAAVEEEHGDHAH
ncbi:MAG: hypothetical protein P8L23_04255 [Flavobacteriales bacterium]|nr:hypothetical protein [Flavobacteriales bacterium]